MLGYRVPDPDEAMLISGGKAGKDDAPFRVVTGRGAFVMPFLRHVNFLTLAMQESVVQEHCVTEQGITIEADAVCAFKVGNDTASIVAAAQRFLSDENQMSVLVGRIVAGHLRSIIGSMTVEKIVRERQALAQEVLEASKSELGALGLLVDSFQISSIDDMGSGYIQAMAAPHTAKIQQEAKVAQAEANRASAEAEQESARKQAEYGRETAVAQAGYKAEVDKAQAAAAQAGPLAEAEAQRAVTEEQTKLAQKKADLRQQELVGEVVKPAEAEAERTRVQAAAEAEAMTVKATAAASSNRVALDRMLIEQLPEIVEKAAVGLSNANVSILDGADGLANVTAGLLSQGMIVYESARKMWAGNGDQPATRPVGEAESQLTPPDSPEEVDAQHGLEPVS
jgi:flotillin